MIVTADAYGDYNATSQILRYSALAREIAVPRIPSITETILSANVVPAHTHNLDPNSCGSISPAVSLTHFVHRPPLLPPGHVVQTPKAQRSFSPTSTVSSEDRATMEHAALEIARLAEENRCLRDSLAREQDGRATVEACLLSMEDRMLDLEQTVREDCVAEFEQRLTVELARWKAGMQMAVERGEEHWDRKMDVFERSLASRTADTEPHGPGDDSEDKENILNESLEGENERLRHEMTVLKRELSDRSPSKRVPLIERAGLTTNTHGSPHSVQTQLVSMNTHDEHNQGEIAHRRLEELTLKVRGGNANNSRASSHGRDADSATSMKKIRKLTTRKWEGDLRGVGDVF